MGAVIVHLRHANLGAVDRRSCRPIDDLAAQAGQLDALLASRETTTIYLKTPVPVYLLYFTAFVADDGDVVMRRDIYGRDKVLIDALRAQGS